MHTIRKAAIGGALTFAALGGGALGATLLNGTAGAQTDPTTSTTVPGDTSTTAPATPAAPGETPADGSCAGGRGGPHGGQRLDETPLTGDVADKVTAAAQAAVPDGTIDRVESDADGSTYEAHVTKADGTHVTVKIDASFAVTSIEEGHGRKPATADSGSATS